MYIYNTMKMSVCLFGLVFLSLNNITSGKPARWRGVDNKHISNSYHLRYP
ncbi:hypothetical protein Hanom_Chr16g01431761 [Helianthus anomalus]